LRAVDPRVTHARYDAPVSPVALCEFDAFDPRSDAFAHAVARAKADFLEMPGLSLTIAQAARLWACDLAYCEAILSALEASGFLSRTRHSAFTRAAAR
jgi:hypothetical protein